ncbi:MULTISPECIES: sensor histidine kinase [Streptosporangium]|uniref:Signal transduction histidine kinase n=1 Tax=Streptosporangium brasiliense TaxID=47480 RepID=A0ABT9R0F8_9ACTN|nr:histidine kinase [Streptosporangium brasiliense]MDP9862711.1 signal transduction histidine kinase [Streptosporangium brasiliense]
MIAAARTAWPCSVLTLALVALSVVLAALNETEVWALSHLLFVGACALAGGLIGSRRPEHVVGRLLALSAFCFALMEVCGQYAILGLLTRPGLPLAEAMAWPQTWLWVPANLSLVLVPLGFPGGTLSSARLRLPVRAVAVAAALTMAVSALRPGENHQVGTGAGVVNPLGVAGLARVAPAAETAMTALMAVVFVAGGIDLLVRAFRSGEPERRQIKWLTYAVGLLVLVVAARLAAGLTDGAPEAIWPAANSPWELPGALGTALMPVAICIAILRHRLFDIDLVINRTLVYALLSGCVTGGYVAVVGYLGAIFPTGDLPVSILAAGLVALVFAPLRERLQSGVNLLMYGERDDPYAALTRLGRRLENTGEPGTVLAGVARAVAEALRLPYAAVETAAGARHASGTAAGDPVRLPLTHNGERVGDLILSPRPGETGFGPRDLRVLTVLAGQVAVAVHAVRLSADLRHSRERLVMAREEERRRLRRDLHDGLGPTLAALTMRAEAVHDLVEDGPARRLLADIVVDAEAAVADVRTLVDGLRPPALDSLGLLGALRAHATRQPPGLRVAVHAPDGLPPLPAATEVAAYRIAAEALANVRRHAAATRAELRVELAGGTLRLEVSDDGGGPGPAGDGGRRPVPEAAGRAGMGLASMRERALELGGSCTVEARPEGGTLVRVVLPAYEEEDAGDPDLAG